MHPHAEVVRNPCILRAGPGKHTAVINAPFGFLQRRLLRRHRLFQRGDLCIFLINRRLIGVNLLLFLFNILRQAVDFLISFIKA